MFQRRLRRTSGLLALSAAAVPLAHQAGASAKTPRAAVPALTRLFSISRGSAGRDGALRATHPRGFTQRRAVSVKPDRGMRLVSVRLLVGRRREPRRLVVAFAPANPLVGNAVRFRVLGAAARSSQYAWTLNGSSQYVTRTGASAVASAIYGEPGPRLVSVRVTDPEGTRLASVRLLVSPRPRPALPAHPSRAPSSRSSPPGRPSHPSTRRATLRARAATDPAVQIADFAFAPGSTTVRVGDTITWTNRGPSGHSATARDGSFDTGILSKGQSASHTFTQAGTFAYFCKIHPFMHGTIVVLAASPVPASPAPIPAVPSSSPPTTPSLGGSTDQPSLPMTGFDLAGVLLAGVAVGGVGAVLRRASTERPD
jgi:plastocyanin